MRSKWQRDGGKKVREGAKRGGRGGERKRLDPALFNSQSVDITCWPHSGWTGWAGKVLAADGEREGMKRGVGARSQRKTSERELIQRQFEKSREIQQGGDNKACGGRAGRAGVFGDKIPQRSMDVNIAQIMEQKLTHERFPQNFYKSVIKCIHWMYVIFTWYMITGGGGGNMIKWIFKIKVISWIRYELDDANLCHIHELQWMHEL